MRARIMLGAHDRVVQNVIGEAHVFLRSHLFYLHAHTMVHHGGRTHTCAAGGAYWIGVLVTGGMDHTRPDTCTCTSRRQLRNLPPCPQFIALMPPWSLSLPCGLEMDSRNLPRSTCLDALLINEVYRPQYRTIKFTTECSTKVQEVRGDIQFLGQKQ